jgi:hypothetical protein
MHGHVIVWEAATRHSLSLSLSLSLCVCVCVSLSLSLAPALCASLSVYHGVLLYLSICMSVFLSSDYVSYMPHMHMYLHACAQAALWRRGEGGPGMARRLNEAQALLERFSRENERLALELGKLRSGRQHVDHDYKSERAPTTLRPFLRVRPGVSVTSKV